MFIHPEGDIWINFWDKDANGLVGEGNYFRVNPNGDYVNVGQKYFDVAEDRLLDRGMAHRVTPYDDSD